MASFQSKVATTNRRHLEGANSNQNFRHLTVRRQSLESRLIYPDDEGEEDSFSHWEQMYFEGETYTDSTTIDEDSMMRSAVRVVTFDLDNTLWKTSGCIGAANDALAIFLDKQEIVQPKRIEKLMGEFFQANKNTYAPLDDNPKGPVLLTQLRTDAIQHVLQEFNGYTEEDASKFAKEAFECWTKARHDAIPSNFAENVLGCLDKISAMKTTSGNPILIGAITDGNSDPRNVDVLKKYFDFCVNAEAVGVGKPDKRVYLEAVRRVVSHRFFEDLGRKPSDSEELLEDTVGPYWVHVGDDFSKDIVPAKGLKMRTIWVHELIRDKLPKHEGSSSEEESRNVEDFVKAVSDKEVIDMTIGAGDYLADSVTREFADRVADEFDELSEMLLSWHNEGTQAYRLRQDLALGETTKANVELSVVPPTSSREEKVISIGDDDYIVATMSSRTFRISREDCSMDVPAPFKNRNKQQMKDIMTMAQLDKSSGVFSFQLEEVEQLQQGKKVLMVEIGSTGIKFTREIFVAMTVDEVLALSEDNPVGLKLFMQQAVDSPSFDLF